MLKNMVENLVSTYKCPFCGAQDISENNIDIVGAAGNTVNIDMHCPSCDKHFMAKTEVMQMELWNISAEKISQLKQAVSALQGKLGGKIDVQMWQISDSIHKKDVIKDESIMGLQKDLSAKKELKVEDLFSDEEKDD